MSKRGIVGPKGSKERAIPTAQHLFKRSGSTIFPSSSARKMTRPLTRLTSGCTWHANHRSARMANFVEAIGGKGL